jgi:hypothetical protein
LDEEEGCILLLLLILLSICLGSKQEVLVKWMDGWQRKRRVVPGEERSEWWDCREGAAA